MFHSLSSLFSSTTDGGLMASKYYCISCGAQHGQVSCPKCGLKDEKDRTIIMKILKGWKPGGKMYNLRCVQYKTSQILISHLSCHFPFWSSSSSTPAITYILDTMQQLTLVILNAEEGIKK